MANQIRTLIEKLDSIENENRSPSDYESHITKGSYAPYREPGRDPERNIEESEETARAVGRLKGKISSELSSLNQLLSSVKNKADLTDSAVDEILDYVDGQFAKDFGENPIDYYGSEARKLSASIDEALQKIEKLRNELDHRS